MFWKPSHLEIIALETMKTLPGRVSSCSRLIIQNYLVILSQGMLTGLLYNKPKDHLAFLENCISLAKTEKDIKWNTFLDAHKKPLPPIPKADGRIKSEATTDEVRTFATEPEMKVKQPLPPINMSGPRVSIDSDKELTEKNILTSESEEEIDMEFSGQRIVFVLGE